MEQLVKQSIGIDISKLSFTACVCNRHQSGEEYLSEVVDFKNLKTGFNQFVKWSRKFTDPSVDLIFVMEATGVYSLPFALLLHTVEAIEVMVVNPKAIKHFATAKLQRGKTDALDAAVILEYLERMPFRPWQPPSDEILEIQHIFTRINDASLSGFIPAILLNSNLTINLYQ